MTRLGAPVVGLLAALLAACAAAPRADDPTELKRAWSAGRIHWPGEEAGLRLDDAGLAEASRRLAGRQVPTVVYAHGCAGLGAASSAHGRMLARAGFVVLAPNSFGRAVKPVSCNPKTRTGSFHRGTLGLRQAEVGYAAMRAAQLPFVDPARIALVGFSEGGIAAATFAGGPFRARVVLGWSCHAAWPEYAGLAAPKDQPVLAVVSSRDPWFSGPTRGDCGAYLSGAKQQSVVIDAPAHDVMAQPAIEAAVTAFLKATLE